MRTRISVGHASGRSDTPNQESSGQRPFPLAGLPVHRGLGRVSSKLIGWRTVSVPSDMVSGKFAVFTSIEVKPAKGRATAEQQNWLQMVRSLGGSAGIARSVQDAQKLLDS